MKEVEGMIFVFFGFLVMVFGFAIVAEVFKDSSRANACRTIAVICLIWLIVSIFGIIISTCFVPVNSNELTYNREMMEFIVENVDFEEVPEEKLEDIAKKLIEINDDLEWYREHEKSFWYYKTIKLPKNSAKIEVNNPRLMEAMKWMIDAKNE